MGNISPAFATAPGIDEASFLITICLGIPTFPAPLRVNDQFQSALGTILVICQPHIKNCKGCHLNVKLKILFSIQTSMK
jgi:hypothetical protein